MKKVIESGKKEFIAVCRSCGCKFSYELEDLYGGSNVHCPECGGSVMHPNQDTTINSGTIINDTITVEDFNRLYSNLCSLQTPRCCDCMYLSYKSSNSTAAIGQIPWCTIHGRQVSPEQPGCLSHKII